MSISLNSLLSAAGISSTKDVSNYASDAKQDLTQQFLDLLTSSQSQDSSSGSSSGSSIDGILDSIDQANGMNDLPTLINNIQKLLSGDDTQTSNSATSGYSMTDILNTI